MYFFKVCFSLDCAHNNNYECITFVSIWCCTPTPSNWCQLQTSSDVERSKVEWGGLHAAVQLCMYSTHLSGWTQKPINPTSTFIYMLTWPEDACRNDDGGIAGSNLHIHSGIARSKAVWSLEIHAFYGAQMFCTAARSREGLKEMEVWRGGRGRLEKWRSFPAMEHAIYGSSTTLFTFPFVYRTTILFHRITKTWPDRFL